MAHMAEARKCHSGEVPALLPDENAVFSEIFHVFIVSALTIAEI
jgi:hypothetical protein